MVKISERVFSELEFRKEQTVISLIAGISPNTLKNLCGNVKSIVQAFPLPPAELHASTTVMTPINEEVRPLFDCLGKTIAVNEFDLAMKILVPLRKYFSTNHDNTKDTPSSHRFFGHQRLGVSLGV